jgi:hypothetical protein
MKDAHKSALAHACEVHNALQAELSAAEQHLRLMLHQASDFELYVNATRHRLHNIKRQVDLCVNIALDRLREADPGLLHSGSWHVPESATLQCPWITQPHPPSQLMDALGRAKWLVRNDVRTNGHL